MADPNPQEILIQRIQKEFANHIFHELERGIDLVELYLGEKKFHDILNRISKKNREVLSYIYSIFSDLEKEIKKTKPSEIFDDTKRRLMLKELFENLIFNDEEFKGLYNRLKDSKGDTIPPNPSGEEGSLDELDKYYTAHKDDEKLKGNGIIKRYMKIIEKEILTIIAFNREEIYITKYEFKDFYEFIKSKSKEIYEAEKGKEDHTELYCAWRYVIDDEKFKKKVENSKKWYKSGYMHLPGFKKGQEKLDKLLGDKKDYVFYYVWWIIKKEDLQKLSDPHEYPRRLGSDKPYYRELANKNVTAALSGLKSTGHVIGKYAGDLGIVGRNELIESEVDNLIIADNEILVLGASRAKRYDWNRSQFRGSYKRWSLIPNIADFDVQQLEWRWYPWEKEISGKEKKKPKIRGAAVILKPNMTVNGTLYPNIDGLLKALKSKTVTLAHLIEYAKSLPPQFKKDHTAKATNAAGGVIPQPLDEHGIFTFEEGMNFERYTIILDGGNGVFVDDKDHYAILPNQQVDITPENPQRDIVFLLNPMDMITLKGIIIDTGNSNAVITRSKPFGVIILYQDKEGKHQQIGQPTPSKKGGFEIKELQKPGSPNTGYIVCVFDPEDEYESPGQAIQISDKLWGFPHFEAGGSPDDIISEQNLDIKVPLKKKDPEFDITLEANPPILNFKEGEYITITAKCINANGKTVKFSITDGTGGKLTPPTQTIKDNIAKIIFHDFTPNVYNIKAELTVGKATKLSEVQVIIKQPIQTQPQPQPTGTTTTIDNTNLRQTLVNVIQSQDFKKIMLETLQNEPPVNPNPQKEVIELLTDILKKIDKGSLTYSQITKLIRLAKEGKETPEKLIFALTNIQQTASDEANNAIKTMNTKERKKAKVAKDG